MKVIFITREGYSLPGARYRAYQFSKEPGKYIGEEARKTAEEELSLKTWGKRMRDWLISII